MSHEKFKRLLIHYLVTLSTGQVALKRNTKKGTESKLGRVARCESLSSKTTISSFNSSMLVVQDYQTLLSHDASARCATTPQRSRY